MTVSPATTPNPRGTAFVQDADHRGRTTAFYAGEAKADYEPLTDFLEKDWPNAKANNAKALRAIALEILTEPRLTDPNVRYAREVHRLILTHLEAIGRITLEELDEITTAFDMAVEHSANAVAAAWLRERGSIPIPGK